MSLVSACPFLARREISSEMSTAESSWTKRSSSIFASSSAIGCSKSRKVVLGSGMLKRLPFAFFRKGAYCSGIVPYGLANASVKHGFRIGGAPQIPGRDRAVRRPHGGEFFDLVEAYAFTVEVVFGHRALQADIAERKHVGAHQVEHEEHLGSPAADAAHLRQRLDHGFVLQLLPGMRLQRTLVKMLGEIDKVFCLALRQPAFGQPFRAVFDHRRRMHLLH